MTATTTYKLYGAPLSTATLRVAIVLHEKKIPFEFVAIDMANKGHKEVAYTAKQPFGQVPYLEEITTPEVTTENPSPEPKVFTLYESRAIIRYLALKHRGSTHGHQKKGPTPNLLPDPADLQAWALFEQAASNEVSNFETFAQRIVFEKVFKPRVGQEPDLKAYEFAYNQLAGKLDVYDKLLANQAYVTGEDITLADLSHIPFGTRLYLAGAGDLIDSRPNVSRWFKSLLERDSWKAVKNGIETWSPN